MSAKSSSESEPLTEVAVIGGSGYLGGKIVKALLQQANMAVRSLDIAEARTPVKTYFSFCFPLLFLCLPYDDVSLCCFCGSPSFPNAFQCFPYVLELGV